VREYQSPTDDQDTSDRLPGSSMLEAIEECAPNPVRAIDAVGAGGLGSAAGAGAVRALDAASRVASGRLTEAMGGGDTVEADELAGGSSRFAGMEECAPEPTRAVDAISAIVGGESLAAADRAGGTDSTGPPDRLRGPVFLGEIADLGPEQLVEQVRCQASDIGFQSPLEAANQAMGNHLDLPPDRQNQLDPVGAFQYSLQQTLINGSATVESASGGDSPVRMLFREMVAGVGAVAGTAMEAAVRVSRAGIAVVESYQRDR
jgi:hypothetical protein